MIAQIDVSRVHVPGYHAETCIYGEEGVIRVGAYRSDPRHVTVESFGRGKVIDRRDFSMRNYNADVPEFINRFGAAYKAEVDGLSHALAITRTLKRIARGNTKSKSMAAESATGI